MYKILSAIFLVTLLGACDSKQPFTFAAAPEPGDTPEPTNPDEEEIPLSGFTETGGAGAIPLDLANNLTNVSYTPGSNTITVSGAPLDTTPIPGTFTRNTSLDIPGYRAYSVQDDPLDRMYIALVAETPNGVSEGGVIIDGGQFGRFFGGSFYRRNNAYTPSNGGLATYTGAYAGLSNLGAPRSGSSDILPVPAGTPGSLIPQEPDRVLGTVFLNVDFADNKINGAIINRVMIGRGTALSDLVLISADITPEGTFLGDVETVTSSDSGLVDVGTYGGAFGGTQATGVAGAVSITDYLEDVDNEAEYGAFVLARCGEPGAGPLCSSVAN